jgi:hypothetical protein
MLGQVISQVLGAAPVRPPARDKTQADQQRLRPSPMWKQVVSAFGRDKAEERLPACQVKPR